MKKFITPLIIVAVIVITVIMIMNNTKTSVEEPNIDNRSTQEQTNDTTTKINKTTFSIEEVNKHNSKDDCWMVIDGNIYDITEFIASGEHPNPKIINGCGIDATVMFEKVKKHSSPKVANIHDQFLIGTLK